MSNQVADVDQDLEEDSQEDYGDTIAEETEKFYQKEFETLRDRELGQDPSRREAAAQQSRGSKSPGIDEVLKEADQTLGKDKADVLRKIQGDYTRTRTEWKIAQREWQGTLKELQREINALKGQPAADDDSEPIDPDLANLSPKQHELFEKLARDKGLISKADLQREADEGRTRDYVKSEAERGIEEFGDRFGYVDEDGEFVYSDDIKDELEETHSRIWDPQRGMTVRDLFIVSQYDKLVGEFKAKAETVATRSAARNGKLDQVRRAAATTRSSTSMASGSPSIYRKGESLDQVIQRASAQAYREV